MEKQFEKPQRIKIDALGYLSGILKNGILKDLQENQILCPVCKGTGLEITNQPYGLSDDPDKKVGLFPYKNQYIVGCRHCYTGVIDVCEYCGKELPKSSLKCDCDAFVAARNDEILKKEQAVLDKAIKLKCCDEIGKLMEMYYFEGYPYNEGYFSNIEEFIEWWEGNHEEDGTKPKYVWGTCEVELSLDASDILERACEELHEEARDDISESEIEKLQTFLDNWCSEQSYTTSYCCDTRYAIEIPW